MLYVDILTIFPDIFRSYFAESILKRAQKARHLSISIHNLRRWAHDVHRVTDARPYGGGAGMVMKVDPIFRAVQALRKKRKTKIVLFSAGGKQFTQKTAKRYAALSHLILICGRYEGVDERVRKYIADEEISIGPYVLTGGEVPAMVVVDAVARLLPGVLGNKESLKEESFSFGWRPQPEPRARGTVRGSLGPSARRRDLVQGEYPHYTRPEAFFSNRKNKRIMWRVSKILLSGNHQKVFEWRRRR